jgi:hypothetical protein
MFASASNQVKQTTEKEQHIQPHRKLFSYSVQIYPGMNLGQTNTLNSNDNLSNNSNTIQLQLTDLNVIPQRSGSSDDLNRSQSQIQIQNQELDEYRALEEKMEKRIIFVISLITIMGIISLAIGLIVSQK